MAQDYVEIVVRGTMAAGGSNPKNVVNVFHYHRTGVGLGISKANIEAAFELAVMTPLLAAVSQDYGHYLTDVRFFDDALDPYASFPYTEQGAIATDRQPDAATVTMQCKTATRGRFARGSKHFAGLVEADTTQDILNAGGITAWSAVRDALLTFTDGDSNIWVLTIKSSRPPADYTSTPVVVVAFDCTSIVLNKTIGTMRRRKPKTVVV